MNPFSTTVRSAGLLTLLLVAVQSFGWSRVAIPPAFTDLTEFTSSPVIFRGRVLSVFPSSLEGDTLSLAEFRVERWYRDYGGVNVDLYFEPYSRINAVNGHACIDFEPGSNWVVFATKENGRLKLVHDCDGAVHVSSLLGQTLPTGEVIAQLEADFEAGLQDQSEDARVLSLQRLAGLRSPLSRSALHRIIERGSSEEARWAAYAAVRTGDATVLPFVRELLANGTSDALVAFLAVELRTLNDPSAKADLIRIADTAPQPAARGAALQALSEQIHATDSVPTLAVHLNDPDDGVRYDALNGLRVLTREPSCTLPSVPQWERMLEQQIQQCRIWWERIGRRQFSKIQ
jgi:hypothetical protein